MKRVFLIVLVITISVSAAFSQTADADYLKNIEAAFEDMGEALAGAIPSTASSGLLWSDAYLGNFPHFGVGAFVGATLIPVDEMSEVLQTVQPSASLDSQILDYGLPVPALGLDARIGGFLLPFDAGVKFAILNNIEAGDATVNYFILGFDARYAIIKGGAVLPKVSVGIGYTRLTTNVSFAGLLSGDIEILPEQTIGVITVPALYLKNPDMEYGWESNIIEFKAQVSKGLLFITPYVGTNISYGLSSVGGGVKTSVVDGAGNPISQEEIDLATEAAGAPSVDTDGFETFTDATGWGVKVYGGTSINLLLMKVDLSVNYDILGKTYGGQVGVRIQF